MLPKKQLNIYPKSDENILAAIDFYFNESNINRDGALEKFKDTSLSLNQIEFVLRKLSEAIDTVFKKNLSKIELNNLVQYGIDALLTGECKSGSQNRKRITLDFKQFVSDTEIDIIFLEKNN
ncbi:MULTISPECIES: hypothetical protein [unclassified Flavobacterium]|uniref:hypothetical protein n=1 Tax=unclassified Flavobacterium TaxID=196869 RepID=UPI001F13E594|nr:MULTISPECIES: hypothetical protein [unclassified Flavobacterium]UMY65116.1 hypothetical protein MKO97_11430 [Flavobacterium sp. HJ-32-4]